jgi:hypothetical protein
MNVKYVGTSDHRTLLAADLKGTSDEDLVFLAGVPTEIDGKVWKVIQADKSYLGEFEETDEEPPAEGQVYVPPAKAVKEGEAEQHGEVSLLDPDFVDGYSPQQLTNPPDQVEPPEGSDDQSNDQIDLESNSTDSGKVSKSGKSK